ncbi:hypothetical protein KM043_002470 [Ampulex compressa]|nr:hypothetical protein KM043_002470 [Ampulex compressa]
MQYEAQCDRSREQLEIEKEVIGRKPPISSGSALENFGGNSAPGYRARYGGRKTGGGEGDGAMEGGRWAGEGWRMGGVRSTKKDEGARKSEQGARRCTKESEERTKKHEDGRRSEEDGARCTKKVEERVARCCLNLKRWAGAVLKVRETLQYANSGRVLKADAVGSRDGAARAGNYPIFGRFARHCRPPTLQDGQKVGPAGTKGCPSWRKPCRQETRGTLGEIDPPAGRVSTNHA